MNKYKHSRKIGYIAITMLIIITMTALWQDWAKDHALAILGTWASLVGGYIGVTNARDGAEKIWSKDSES